MSYWYGLSFEDVAEMPFAAIRNYLERLPARQTETKLLLADVISFPHMKKGDRQTAMRQWMKIAQPRRETELRPASPAILKLMGIGVEYVK